MFDATSLPRRYHDGFSPYVQKDLEEGLAAQLAQEASRRPAKRRERIEGFVLRVLFKQRKKVAHLSVETILRVLTALDEAVEQMQQVSAEECAQKLVFLPTRCATS